MSKLPCPLSAKFVGSFAYDTIKDRLPTILAKVVDTTHRQRHEIAALHGDVGLEDVKKIVGALSELRYRMSTDKPITNIETKHNDGQIWKQAHEQQKQLDGGEPSWFRSPWLYIECFMYRKIAAIFEDSIHLHDWDPFLFQKEQGFVGGLSGISILGDYLLSLLEKHENKPFSEEEKKDTVLKLLQISLWGNQYDLSISAGEQQLEKDESPIDRVETLADYILVNELQQAYELLNSNGNSRVDFIMDNAGMELVSDLCLAEFLLQSGMAKHIVFHVKAMPWFVSDTTILDFSWTLEMLRSSKVKSLNILGHKWHQRWENDEFQVKTHQFWTLPYPFCEMSRICPDLHEQLSKSKVLIFKGDLNYRKLTSDLDWATTTTFEHSLRGFRPAPLVAIRTLKANLVVGLKSGQADKLTKDNGNTNWMVTGDYAVIQCLK